ncbi:enoyl-CoA hydratase/isomerase family protein [bacterium]|nr:enoyl-CoA hydratase/isomerase family protein [bacterium]
MDRKHLSLELKENGTAVITLDMADSKVNLINFELLTEFSEVLDEVVNNPSVRALLVNSAKPGQFIAGADIQLIQGIHSIEAGYQLCVQAQEIFSKLAGLSIPTLCAIQGPCLGGGLEIALCFQYRLASDENSTVVGLPEVQLGVLPGLGGTQRLPRLIGLQAALDMILTGRKVKAPRALRLGLVDEVVPAALLQKRALHAATELRDRVGQAWINTQKRGQSKASSWLGKLAARSFLPMKLRQDLEKKTKGHYPAPFKALESVLNSQKTTLQEGLRLEAELFAECATTSVSKALIHLYEITTQNRADSGRMADAVAGPKGKVGVLGAGLMGSGIAAVAAAQGYSIVVKDQNAESAGRALAYADRVYSREVERKRIRGFEKNLRLNRILPTTTYGPFDNAHVVIEAVFEDLAVKHQVLKDVEATNPDAIFASNTSAIPITDIAKGATRPAQVLGMHFFSPVEKMQLVEVITTSQTSKAALNRVVKLSREMNTHVIVVNDGPGFFTSRVLSAFLGQALLCYAEGTPADQIDSALTEVGFPVGPMTLIDEVGLDVAAKVMKVMSDHLPERFPKPAGWEAISADGRAGKKSSKGFYLYSKGKKVADAVLHQKVVASATSRPLTRRDIQERCLYAFLCESLHCLEEGILRSQDDGDLASVFGLGFPPFLGGPFFLIKQQGVETTMRKLEELQKKFGVSFAAPASSALATV